MILNPADQFRLNLNRMQTRHPQQELVPATDQIQPYLVSKISNLNLLDPNEKLYREIRNLLNKLTPQNMENITNKLIMLPIETEEQLIGSIEIIFKTSVDEQNFSQIYAQLCKSLSSSIKVKSSSNPLRTVSFRTMLLTRCQKEFNTDYYQEINYDQLVKEADQFPNELKQKELKDQAEEKLQKAKRRSLGNIRFIGELFKLGMLTDHIMTDCIERLLKQDTDEENLECLCRLLTTIGKEVDSQANALKMKYYFDHLERIVKRKDKIKSRIRFMILDVIDLRKNQWLPRRKSNNPRLLDEIRKEAQLEVEEKTLNKSNNSCSSTSDEKRSNSPNDLYEQKIQKSIQTNMIKKITEVKQITCTSGNDLLLGPRGSASGFNWTHTPKPAQVEQIEPTVEEIKPVKQAEKPAEKKFNYNEANFTDRQTDLGIENCKLTTTTITNNNNNNKKTIRNNTFNNNKQHHHGHPNSRQDKIHKNNRQNHQSKYSNRGNTFKRRVYSSDEIEQRVNLFLDEYNRNNNLIEALKDFEEFRPKDESQYIDYLELIFNKALERTDELRTSIGFFFYAALNEKLLSIKLFTLALKNLIELIEEISIDAPRITLYLSQIISPLIQPNFSIEFLTEAFQPIQDKPICTELITEILSNCLKRLEASEIIELFRVTNFQIDDLLRLIEKQKTLKKLLNSGDNHAFEANVKKLLKLMENTYVNSSELVIKKIENEFTKSDLQSKAFIRALAASICLSSLDQVFKFDACLFKKRAFLLNKYINSNQDLELECLNAFQFVDQKLQHQYSFIRYLFDVCYDEKIISESSFWKWKNDSAEDGHDASVLKLAGFYVWLTESV